MTNPKGTAHETKIVRLMRRMFWPDADRLVKTGRLDRGDLRGPSSWTFEAKDLGKIDLPGMLSQARKEAANDGRRWFAAIQKARRGKNSSGSIEDAYLVMTLERGLLAVRAVELLELLVKHYGVRTPDVLEWAAKVDEICGPPG